MTTLLRIRYGRLRDLATGACGVARYLVGCIGHLLRAVSLRLAAALVVLFALHPLIAVTVLLFGVATTGGIAGALTVVACQQR